jgi:hypothetical protein
MWIVVSALAVFIWLIFVVRGRPLASTLDRGEVMVLKPLSMTYLLLTIAFAVSGAWLVAAVCAIAWLLNGMIGALLHKWRTCSELSEGTLQYMQKGPRIRLSDAESRKLASVLLRATMILGVVLAALFLHYPLRWYFAIPAALLAAWVFLTSSTILVAYQRKHA